MDSLIEFISRYVADHEEEYLEYKEKENSEVAC